MRLGESVFKRLSIGLQVRLKAHPAMCLEVEGFEA